MIETPDPSVIGVILSSIASIIVGFYGIKKSITNDRLAKEGVDQGKTNAVITGQDILIENLQEDNRIYREDNKRLREGLDQALADLAIVRETCRELERTIKDLKKQITPRRRN